MKKLGILFIVAAFWMGCEETIQLDLDQTAPRVVIEAQVLNGNAGHFVKITRTAGFYQSGPVPRITDAVVQVSDSEGGVFPFVHNPGQHPDSVGFYLPATELEGIVGLVYTLRVEVGGEVYEAEDALLSIQPIEALSTRINPRQQQNPEEPGRYYEVLLFASEPQETQDFYLFKFYRNDSIMNGDGNFIYVADDTALGENINGIPAPVYYKEGEWAKVEIYSLTRAGYRFFFELSNLINNDGGMFSPPPANPTTNLSNGALGFFQVSSRASDSILVSSD
jgi:hypothetical protein